MDYAAAVRSKKYSQQHGETLKMRYRMKKIKGMRSDVILFQEIKDETVFYKKNCFQLY